MSLVASLQGEILRVLSASSEIVSKFGDPVRLVSGDGAKSAFPFIRIERHEVRTTDPSGAGPEDHRVRFEILSRNGGRTEAGLLVQMLSDTLRTMNRQLDDVRIVLVHPVYSDVFLRNDGISYRGVLRLRLLIEPGS